MNEQTRTVARALDVLLCFSHESPELSLTEISARVGLHKSTLHRLLGTLESERFVQRDDVTGKYRLGTRLLELASLVAEHSNLQGQAKPHLIRLAQQCAETVDLSILDGSEIMYLEVIESSQRVKLAARPGQRLPAHSTASGKAILAFLPDSTLDTVLPAEFTRYTDGTLVERETLMKDLRAARERGFAMSLGEHETGINAAAAPVLDPNGLPIAAVAVAGPAYRLTLERMLETGSLVRAAAESIAREVGTTRS